MELYEKCLAGKHRGKYTITASMVLKYCISPFLVWCDAFAPPEERDAESEYRHLLFKRGAKHEDAVLDTMFPGAVEVPLVSFEKGFREVLEECKKGAGVLAQAPLFFLEEDLFGIPDVLERSDSHDSVFGDYHYVVKEIKSAKHIKREYVMQAAFYNYLLGRIQGFTPPKFYLINREEEVSAYQYEKVEEELRMVLDGVREVLEGKDVSPTAKAARWPWESYANKRAVEANDVSILPAVGQKVKEKLNAAGVFTVKQLLEQSFEVNIPDKTLEKMKLYAQAWVDGEPVVLQKPRLPKSDVEIYIDFEGTDEVPAEEGTTKVTYLIGLLVKDRDHVFFRPFVAESLADEGVMLEEFLAFMQDYRGVPLYHYGHYEKTHMKLLGEKYKVGVSWVLDSMIDVLSVLKKSVALPTLGMSLKKVADYLGFSWRGMADAQESIVLYFRFLETKERELLKRIIDYNEDDVRATKVVKEFLAGLEP